MARIRCAPLEFSSPDDDVRSVSLTWFDVRQKLIANRKQSRLSVDESLHLVVAQSQPEDAGIYLCVMTVILGDAKSIQLRHTIHLNGQSKPVNQPARANG